MFYSCFSEDNSEIIWQVNITYHFNEFGEINFVHSRICKVFQTFLSLVVKYILVNNRYIKVSFKLFFKITKFLRKKLLKNELPELPMSKDKVRLDTAIKDLTIYDSNLHGDVLLIKIIVHAKQRERIISSPNGLINNVLVL